MPTGTRGAAGFPVAGHGFAGNKKVAWGSVSLGATPIAGVYQMCRIPKGALVIGGRVASSQVMTTTASVGVIDVGVGSTLTSGGAFMATVTLSVSGMSAAPAPAAGSISVPLGGVIYSAGSPYEATGEDIITVTLSTAVGYTSTLSAKVWVEVDYLLP